MRGVLVRRPGAGLTSLQADHHVRTFMTNIEELRAALKSVGDRPALPLIHRGDNSLLATIKPTNGYISHMCSMMGGGETIRRRLSASRIEFSERTPLG